MAKKVGRLDIGDVENLRAESVGLLNDLDSIGKSISESLKEVSKTTKESTTAFQESFNAAKSLGKSIASIDAQTLSSRKEQLSFQKQVRKAEQEATKLQSKAQRLRSESVNLSKKQAALVLETARYYEDGAEKLKQQAESAGKIVDEFEELNKQTKFFDGMADLVKDIPGLSKVFKDFQKASDAAREAGSEGGSSLKAGAKELSKTLGKAATGLVISTAVKAFKDADERVTSLSRNLNRSNQEAIDLTQSANKAARSIAGVTGRDITQAQNDFGSALKVTTPLSNEIAANFSTLQTKLGLSVDEAAEFTKFNEALGKNSKEQTDTLIGQIELQNAQNNTSLRYQDIIKTIAGTNKAILLSIEGQGKSLSNAAYQASRLGLTLNQVDSTASSLLNFETSIASEIKAELLLNRQLNLDKARQAALNNDLETVTREIAENIGTAAEFSKLNRIQQEALAGAVGMSREELAASFIEQEAITKLGAKDVNEARAKIKERLREINAIQDLTKREEARAAFAKKIGSEEYLRQQENRSLTELQTELAQKLLETFDKVAHALSPLKGTFKFIIDNIEIAAGLLTAIAGISLVTKFGKLLKIFSKLSGFAKNIFKFFGKLKMPKMPKMPKMIPGVGKGTATATKTAGKGLGKTVGKAAGKFAGKGLLKRIPILGSAIGVGFAIDRALKGDGVGALMELGSAGLGLLDLVAPGVGTGLSLAADAGIAARDLKRAGTITPGPPAEDFIMRPGQGVQKFRKDDIVIGGTNLLGGDNNGNNEVISLLKELIHTVKSGGDIYMDGNKVGKSLAMATSNFS